MTGINNFLQVVNKFKIIGLLLFVFILGNFATAQTLNITIEDSEARSAMLHSVSGEKLSLIDTLQTEQPGVFTYVLQKEKIFPGLYRLSFKSGGYIHLILEPHENIRLRTKLTALIDSMNVQESESNLYFYTFVRMQKEYKIKADLLNVILAKYPKNDDYYQVTLAKMAELKNTYASFVNSVKSNNPASFVTRYISSLQLVFPATNLPIEKTLEFYKTHGLDHVDYNDFTLVKSDVFANTAIEYLMYYRNPNLPKEMLEKEFSKAVDTLLQKARKNQIVYQHVAEYLIDGFKKFGFDNVIDYIVENYAIKDDLCLSEQTEAMIKNRVEQARIFKPGYRVPPISYKDKTGNANNLLLGSKKNTLIVFYATWCPHCKELLPKLYDVYKTKQSINVIAISLDTKISDWQSFTEKSCPDWINKCDGLGWEGNEAKSYYLYATPTMFFVDADGKLLAKPTRLEDIPGL